MNPDDAADDTSGESTPQNSSESDTQSVDTGTLGGDQTGVSAFAQTDADHRLYGAERITFDPDTAPTQGLLTLREFRLLEHASKFDRAYQNSLYALLDRRIEQFTESEWPVIQDMYPEYADRVQQAVCESEA